MQLYCGIDLHSNNIMVSLIDDTERLISEQRLDNNLQTIAQHLQAFAQDLAGIVVESTYNWYWLVDGLIKKDYTVHLEKII